VTVFEKTGQLGGRLRSNYSEEELPAKTLDAEIEQIVRLGLDLRMETPVGKSPTLKALRDEFDAVIVACGSLDAETIEFWGLKPGKRGVQVDKGTYQTELPGVFAAGGTIRGKSQPVRSVADGKEVALAAHLCVSGQPVVPLERPFSSRIGRITPEQIAPYLGDASKEPLRNPSTGAEEYTPAEAALQSDRCLICGCLAHGDCKLERYSALYEADPGQYRGEQRPFVQHRQHGSVIYEPGKCIDCGLCIDIAAEAGEPLGLTFIGRGFDVRVGVPFERSMQDALGRVARQCVEACPTAALAFRGEASCHCQRASASEE